MRRIQIHILLAVAVCAMLCGCAERAQTLDEYLADYNAKRAELNKGPTVVAAVERAGKLIAKVEWSDEASEGYHALMKSPDWLEWSEPSPRYGHMQTHRTFVPGTPEVPKALRQAVDAHKAAFAEIREARDLLGGYPALKLTDFFQNERGLEAGESFEASAHGARGELYYAYLVDLADGKREEARQRCLDMLTIEKGMANAPSILEHLAWTLNAGFADTAALRVALSGPWNAESLEELAAEMETLDINPDVVLPRALRFERARSFAAVDKIAAMDDEELDKFLTDFHQGQLKPHNLLVGLMKQAPHEEPAAPEKVTVEEVRRRLPGDREVIVEAYRELGRALARPGAKIKDRYRPNMTLTEPEELGIVGRAYGPWVWEGFQWAVAQSCAKRRAAVALLRALAFRARKGRLPRAGELKMAKDPFRPDKRMTYVYDKKNNRIGVYAIGWETTIVREKGGEWTNETR